MPKKLLLFGGLSVASVATFTPGGIFLHKAIKTEQIKKERIILVSKAGEAADRLNGEKSNEGKGISFQKDSSDSDVWKLMWIWDVFKYYQKYKKPLQYTKIEMEEAEEFYWNEQVSKQQGKWSGKSTVDYLKKTNSKSQYWEKFKEICLILMANDQIKGENMNLTNEDMLLCSRVNVHDQPLSEYKKISSSSNGIMEYFWTVYAKPSTN